MRLTLHSDYAVRILMYAALKGDALSTVDEIVAHFEIPKGYATRVVHHLGRLGYLETIRGKSGGIRLARKPRQVNLGAVIRDMGEELDVIGCLQRDGFCRIEGCCVLRGALRDAMTAFLRTLDGYTLADLVRPRRKLIESLNAVDLTA